VFGGVVLIPRREKGIAMKEFVMRANALLMVVLVSGMFGASMALAQDPTASNQVTFQPIVEFGDLFSSLTDAIGPLVAGALVLGLSIWAARYVFGIIKSMGR
jgi:hypothetical protein